MSVKSGNPFLETSSDILVLDTRDIVEKSGVYNVYRMESQGCQQYYNLYANGSCSHEEVQYTLNPHKRQRTTSSGLVSSLKVTATFSRDCLLHLSFVMVTSMIISLTRINHVHHHCQPEGNSNWAPNRILFDA